MGQLPSKPQQPVQQQPIQQTTPVNPLAPVFPGVNNTPTNTQPTSAPINTSVIPTTPNASVNPVTTTPPISPVPNIPSTANGNVLWCSDGVCRYIDNTNTGLQLGNFTVKATPTGEFCLYGSTNKIDESTRIACLTGPSSTWADRMVIYPNADGDNYNYVSIRKDGGINKTGGDLSFYNNLQKVGIMSNQGDKARIYQNSDGKAPYWYFNSLGNSGVFRG